MGRTLCSFSRVSQRGGSQTQAVLKTGMLSSATELVLLPFAVLLRASRGAMRSRWWAAWPPPPGRHEATPDSRAVTQAASRVDCLILRGDYYMANETTYKIGVVS